MKSVHDYLVYKQHVSDYNRHTLMHTILLYIDEMFGSHFLTYIQTKKPHENNESGLVVQCRAV